MTIKNAHPRLVSMGMFPGKVIEVKRIIGSLVQIEVDNINIVMHKDYFKNIELT